MSEPTYGWIKLSDYLPENGAHVWLFCDSTGELVFEGALQYPQTLIQCGYTHWKPVERPSHLPPTKSDAEKAWEGWSVGYTFKPTEGHKQAFIAGFNAARKQ